MKTKASPIAQAPGPRSPADGPGKQRVRDRIFQAACELFYRSGIRGVGVEAIAAHAGTNKMSFYRSFCSKDELVAAYVRDAASKYLQWWDAVVAEHAGDPRAQVLALFEASVHRPAGNCERGCAMANAIVEIQENDHAALAVIREHKHEIRRRLRELAAAMKAPDAELLGDSLMLLMSGCFQSRMIFPGLSGPISAAADTARTVIDAHLRRRARAAPAAKTGQRAKAPAASARPQAQTKAPARAAARRRA